MPPTMTPAGPTRNDLGGVVKRKKKHPSAASSLSLSAFDSGAKLSSTEGLPEPPLPLQLCTPPASSDDPQPSLVKTLVQELKSATPVVPPDTPKSQEPTDAIPELEGRKDHDNDAIKSPLLEGKAEAANSDHRNSDKHTGKPVAPCTDVRKARSDKPVKQSKTTKKRQLSTSKRHSGDSLITDYISIPGRRLGSSRSKGSDHDAKQNELVELELDSSSGEERQVKRPKLDHPNRVYTARREADSESASKSNRETREALETPPASEDTESKERYVKLEAAGSRLAHNFLPSNLTSPTSEELLKAAQRRTATKSKIRAHLARYKGPQSDKTETQKPRLGVPDIDSKDVTVLRRLLRLSPVISLQYQDRARDVIPFKTLVRSVYTAVESETEFGQLGIQEVTEAIRYATRHWSGWLTLNVDQVRRHREKDADTLLAMNQKLRAHCRSQMHPVNHRAPDRSTGK